MCSGGRPSQRISYIDPAFGINVNKYDGTLFVQTFRINFAEGKGSTVSYMIFF